MGIYCSLVRKTFLAAWISTVLGGLALPWLLASSNFIFGIWSLFRESYAAQYSGTYVLYRFLVSGIGVQLLFAVIAAFRLFRNLRRREFAFA
jgi:hypothetical protein